MKPLTRSLVRHAHAVARENGARVVLLHADVVEHDEALSALMDDVNFRVLLASRRADLKVPDGRGDCCQVVRVPDIPTTRAGQIRVAILVAAAEGLVRVGDRVVCLTGLDGSGTLDTILVLDLGREIEMFAESIVDPLPADVLPVVFSRLLALATELGLEGREGHPVGILFILGDCDRVLGRSHQLVINPFHGHDESDRNVLDPRLEETIKEFSGLDGAFIVRGDGLLLSAGRYLIPREKPDDFLPLGLGARHEAAAGITSESDAIALCVSQSTGTVSVFRRGRLVIDVQKPRSMRPEDL